MARIRVAARAEQPFGVTFGDLLKQQRKRAGMTQAELGALVGLSLAHISHLEKNQRLPDVKTVTERFIGALNLQDDPRTAMRLIELAALARGEKPPPAISLLRKSRRVLREEVGQPLPMLPAQPTRLIGRDAEVNLLVNSLLHHDGRLLTLLGPPGVGKTRLGLAVAAHLQATYRDGACFVPLAAINAPELVISALIGALGLADTSYKPPQKRVIEYLRHKEMLLLLDNFEQIGGAAPLVATLLAECPALRIVVTSRERLHLRAEQRYAVQPLGVAAACELFAHRAQAIDPSFAVTAENQPIITAICRRLDCLPLALELSAVQIDLFSPADLLARLHDRRFDLLAQGPQDLPARQRTLRTAIQDSYFLLNETEQALFRRLGLFVGGFEREAVANLGFDAAILQALLNKSLVRLAGVSDGRRRFELLETLRLYAYERLVEANELPAGAQSHAQYVLTIAEEAERHFATPQETAAYNRLEAEQGNIRAALQWTLEQDVAIGLRLVGVLAIFWHHRGYWVEGRSWLEKLLARIGDKPMPETVTRMQAAALTRLGDLAWNQGDYAAGRLCHEQSLAIYQALGEQQGVASALASLGIGAREQGDVRRAADLLEQCLALFRALGATTSIPWTLCSLGEVAVMQGDPQRAQTLLQESLHLFQTEDNLLGVAWTLNHLGHVAQLQADYGQALDLHTQSLTLFTHRDKLGVAWARHSLGWVAVVTGNPTQAHIHYTESLTLFQELNDKKGVAWCLAGFALIAHALAQPVRAAQLWGAAEALCTESGGRPAPGDPNHDLKMMAMVRTQLGEIAFAAAWTKGQAMALEEILQYPLITDLASTKAKEMP